MTRHPRQKVDWTPDQFEALQYGAAQGWSAATIAEWVGGGCTRSAVLGMARRRGIALLVESTHAIHRRRVQLHDEPAAAPAEESIPDVAPEPAQESMRAIVEAHPAFLACRGAKAPSPCQWPIGDPQEQGFHFCGADAVPGKSYCPEHRAIANTPSKPYDPEAARKARGPFRASQVGQWS